MKSNKGFTLIELLAVIVVLAIIALIATPMVLNIIDDAKEGAARSSAYAYIHAVEIKIAADMVKTEATGTTTITTPNYTKVKGDQPEADNLKLEFEKGIVKENSTISVNGYDFKMNANGELETYTVPAKDNNEGE